MDIYILRGYFTSNFITVLSFNNIVSYFIFFKLIIKRRYYKNNGTSR